jgi:hypothetical protein
MGRTGVKSAERALYVARPAAAAGDNCPPGAGVIVLQWLRFGKFIRNNKLAREIDRLFKIVRGINSGRRA